MKTIKLLLIGLLVLGYSVLYSQKVYIYDESGNKLYFQKNESVKFVSINPSSTTEQRELIKQNLKRAHANNFQEKTPLLYRITLNTEREAKLLRELQRGAKDLCISPMLMYADSTVQLIIVQGAYGLEITTQYSVGAILKEPRTAVFDRTLTVQ